LTPDAVSLEGRVAVVTGGGSGIGRGIAMAFAQFGAKVAIWEKDPATAESAATEADGLACAIDVRDADQVESAMTATFETFGVPTILVNNAGGVFSSPLLDTSPRGWDALIRSNLTHVLLCTQRVARAMVGAAAASSMSPRSRVSGPRPDTPPTLRPRPASSTSPRRQHLNSLRTASG
jgi:3-oxoacyl-[acyl-carrier protein] reductase